MLVYDFEVFKYNWLVVIKKVGTDDYTIIQDDVDKLREFYNEHTKSLWIGFNNKNYDNNILRAILSNVDPYEWSRLLIQEDKQPYMINKVLGVKNLPLLNMDLIQDILGMSLKEAEGYMCMSIEESNVDFNLNRPLTQSEIEETIFYCKHDVDATEKLLEKRMDYVKSKMNLVKEFKLNPSHLESTNAKLCATILQATKKEYDDELSYDLPSEIVLGKYKHVLDLYTQDKLDYTQKRVYNIAGVDHLYAYGGLHGAIENFFYQGEMWQIDAASYYPTLMIQYNYNSRNMKDPSKYEHIYKTRIAAKKTDKPKAAALKLVINTTYGAMKSKYNELYDPHMANQVCITGQLFLTDLIEKIEPYCKLVQSNTDGILIIPYDKDKIREEVKKVEERSRVIFEIDSCTGVWQKDVNNYIMTFDDGHVKVKGGYVSQYDGEGIRNTNRIVDVAVVDYFIKGVDPAKTIMDCMDKYMFQIITKTGGTYEETYWKHKDKDIKVNKVNRVYASKDESYGNLYKVKYTNNKIRHDSIANLPEHCIVDNSDTISIDDINKSWYINMAWKRIKDFKGE